LRPAGEQNIEIVVADDAAPRLAERVARAGWRAAVVVADANTQAAAGGHVAGELRSAGVATSEVVFAERSGLVADASAVAKVRFALRGGSYAVAVGAGVITDVVRYASHLEERGFVSVPTAASMDGYASSVAALDVGGVKVTQPARAPEGIFADPRVIAAAPRELAGAGVGDLLGKVTAQLDWLAAHVLYGEDYCAIIADDVLEAVALVAADVDAVLGGDLAATELLLRALIRSGLAITAFGNSRPASGCEHHASHFWDLLAARGMRAHAAHGLQVGYACRLAMSLQRFAFAGGVDCPPRPAPVSDPLGVEARAWLGEPTAEIVAAVERKQRQLALVPAGWPSDQDSWRSVRTVLAPAFEHFPAAEQALARAGFAAGPGYLGLDSRTLRATFRHASRLRARYTTIDFLDSIGALEAALDDMLG
jgi:glycerol-1-phosphate dehydrogenase [NAD(P)+]